MLGRLAHTGKQFGAILNSTFSTKASEEVAKNMKAMGTVIKYLNGKAEEIRAKNSLEGRVSCEESHFRSLAEHLEVEEWRLRQEHLGLSTDKVTCLKSIVCQK